MLADLRPDILALKMALIRGIDDSVLRRTIIPSVVHMAEDLGIQCIAEGIETPSELQTLREIGFCQGQGYLLVRPVLQALPSCALAA